MKIEEALSEMEDLYNKAFTVIGREDIKKKRQALDVIKAKINGERKDDN